MAKKPASFLFDVHEWLLDQKVSICPIVARGLLIDLVCWAFLSKEGHLRGTIDRLAPMCRCTEDEFTAGLAVLRETGAVEIKEDDGMLSITPLDLEFSIPADRYIP